MELRRYALLMLRWSWLLVLGAAFAGGAAYVTSKLQVPVYESTSVLLVSQSKAATILDAATLYNADRLSATYVELMHDRPVLDEVIRRLGLKQTSLTLDRAVKVTLVRNTQLIQVRAEDTDPARAAAIANEIPKVFIQQNDEMQNRRFVESEASLQKGMQAAQDRAAQLQTQIAGLQASANPDQSAIDRLRVDLTAKQSEYANLAKSYQDVRLEGARQLDTLLVTRQAQPAYEPVRPKTMQNTLLAAIVGLLLALGVVYLIEYLDDVFKTPYEVKLALGLTTLSSVPVIEEKKATGELTVVANAYSAATEAYRALRINLQFAVLGKPLRSLLVTSTSPLEGKTITAANLGAVMAQVGKRVLLVDADLHRPRLHQVFKLGNKGGLTTALLDEGADLESLSQNTEVPGLRILTSGPLPPNAAELLSSSRMKAVLADLQEIADLVIFDSPPTMALSDAAVLATQTDGTLLVLYAGRTRRELAKRAVANLQQVRAPIVGVVLNCTPTRGPGARYHYHYYGHYGYYGSQDGSGKDGDNPNGRAAGGRGFLGRLRRPLQAILSAVQR